MAQLGQPVPQDQPVHLVLMAQRGQLGQPVQLVQLAQLVQLGLLDLRGLQESSLPLILLRPLLVLAMLGTKRLMEKCMFGTIRIGLKQELDLKVRQALQVQLVLQGQLGLPVLLESGRFLILLPPLQRQA